MTQLQDSIPTISMRCDCTLFRCDKEVRRAPVIVIPSRTPFAPGHRVVRIHTPLHYCEWHRGMFDVQSYLSGQQKRRIELEIPAIRPKDFKPDFDQAFADLVLVTTPEYRRFLRYIGARDAAA
jgi:hypothetical protein